MVETVSERDREIKRIGDQKEKVMQTLHETNRNVTNLEHEVRFLKDEDSCYSADKDAIVNDLRARLGTAEREKT